MTKHKSEPKAIPLPKIKKATASFSQTVGMNNEKISGSNFGANRAERLLLISEEHSDGATPKSKPVDGFSDILVSKKSNKRSTSIQKTHTTLIE